jgi:RND family efflux transporter MFP subunit
VGTNLDPIQEPDAIPPQPVAWIGRDRAAERVTSSAPPIDPSAVGEPTGTRRWVLTGAVVLVLLLLVVGAWKLFGHSKPATDTLAERAALQSVTSSVQFTGAIAARYDMPIANEGETGRITGVFVEAGDKVKRGQLLARIDDSVLVQQVNRLAASLEQARAQAALSAAEFKRAQGVEAAGALSAEDIEKRRATSVTDAANVKVVAAQLAEAQARLARTHLTAPVDGVVLTRHAEVGQIANPGGDPLFRIASGGEVEMRGQIAEQDLAAVKTGQSANVYLTGTARAYPGTVRLLGAVIDPVTRLGDIRIQLKPDPALRPGAFARAEVSVDKAQRPVLPQTAVMADAGGSYVLIVNAANKVERRPVKVAGLTDAGTTISSGLSGNERVVATAGGFLREGEEVRIAPAPAAATK